MRSADKISYFSLFKYPILVFYDLFYALNNPIICMHIAGIVKEYFWVIYCRNGPHSLKS